MKRYLMNLLIAIDELGNAILAGSPDETISSRAGRAQSNGRRWALVLCWMLDWLEHGHCARVAVNEGGKQVYPEVVDLSGKDHGD